MRAALRTCLGLTLGISALMAGLSPGHAESWRYYQNGYNSTYIVGQGSQIHLAYFGTNKNKFTCFKGHKVGRHPTHPKLLLYRGRFRQATYNGTTGSTQRVAPLIRQTQRQLIIRSKTYQQDGQSAEMLRLFEPTDDEISGIRYGCEDWEW